MRRGAWLLLVVAACGDDGASAKLSCESGDLECFLDSLVITEGGETVPLARIASLPMGPGSGPGGGSTPVETNEVWFAGDNGFLARWRGGAQYEVLAHTTQTLMDVAGNGTTVWAVGVGGTTLHIVGNTVTPTNVATTQTLTGVAAFAGGEAWIVGTPGNGSGYICRSVGTDWDCATPPSTPILRDVFIPPVSGHVYATGGDTNNGVFMDYNTSWTSTASTSGYSVWGTGPTDIWVAGATLQHWNGSELSTVSIGSTNTLRAITGTAANDIWVAEDYVGVRHYDGSTWSAPMTLPRRVLRMHAVAPNEVWAVGEGGMIRRWDGATWTSPITGPVIDGSINGVWASGPITGGGGGGGGGVPSISSITPASLTYTPRATQEITINWNDPPGCQPAFCFSACSKTARCFAPARCTRSIPDGLTSGSNTYRVGYTAVPIGSTAAQFDLWVTPISMPDCGNWTEQGEVPADALVGGGTKVEQTLEPEPMQGSGSGSGSGDYSVLFEIQNGTCTSQPCSDFLNCVQYNYTCSGIVRGPVGARVNDNSGVGGENFTVADWHGVEASSGYIVREQNDPMMSAWTSSWSQKLNSGDAPSLSTTSCAGYIDWSHDGVLISNDTDQREIVCNGGNNP